MARLHGDKKKGGGAGSNPAALRAGIADAALVVGRTTDRVDRLRCVLAGGQWPGHKAPASRTTAPLTPLPSRQRSICRGIPWSGGLLLGVGAKPLGRDAEDGSDGLDMTTRHPAPLADGLRRDAAGVRNALGAASLLDQGQKDLVSHGGILTPGKNAWQGKSKSPGAEGKGYADAEGLTLLRSLSPDKQAAALAMLRGLASQATTKK